MRYMYDANTIISEVMVLDKELTEEEILLYSQYPIKAPEVNNDSEEPFKKLQRNEFGEIRNTIKSGYPFKGNVREQTLIEANCLYLARINNKLVKVLATQTKSWTLGTDIADSSMKEYTVKLLRGE